MKAEQDLNSQQEHLAAIDYDLRITNLARFIYRKVQRVTYNAKRPKLIDVGAGNGLFLKFFKNHGFEVTGIELEKYLVEKMKKDPQLEGVGLSQGDITKLTGKANYDVAIASDVIEHIKDDKKALENLWTFLKPGGLLIITVPAHSHLYGKRDVAWGHFRRYDKKVLVEKIKMSISNRHPELDSGSRKMPKQVRHDAGFIIKFIGFWNIVGYFVYFFYEKVLHKQINEEMRYGKSFKSKIVRTVLDYILKIEEMIGGLPLGLTLVAVVKKEK